MTNQHQFTLYREGLSRHKTVSGPLSPSFLFQCKMSPLCAALSETSLCMNTYMLVQGYVPNQLIPNFYLTLPQTTKEIRMYFVYVFPFCLHIVTPPADLGTLSIRLTSQRVRLYCTFFKKKCFKLSSISRVLLYTDASFENQMAAVVPSQLFSRLQVLLSVKNKQKRQTFSGGELLDKKVVFLSGKRRKHGPYRQQTTKLRYNRSPCSVTIPFFFSFSFYFVKYYYIVSDHHVKKNF